ncbi:MAG: hypothetical protein HQK78_16880 [Desulfobacterales bacterium]|nr:hypothetical protein [Desulfobacterales bacterium]
MKLPIQQEKRNAAKRLLEIGMDIETIIKVPLLNKEDIEELSKPIQ